MPTAADRKRFESIQRRYAENAERRWRYEADVLLSKYGKTRPLLSWLTTTERKRLDAFTATDSRLLDDMMALLGRVSPRYWGALVPVAYIMSDLSWEDAITSGPLSVVPRPGYGVQPSAMQQFAQAVA